MALRKLCLFVLLVIYTYTSTEACTRKQKWSPCSETKNCGHRPWKTEKCVDCRDLGLNNPPEWKTQAVPNGIDFSGNSLTNTVIPTTYSVSLKYLSLANNKLSTTGAWNVSNWEGLKYLFLNENRIKSLQQDAFTRLKNLKWLDLSNNLIRSENIDIFWAGNTSKLTGLDLSSNLLDSLTRRIFIGLSFLRNLYLWDNNISILKPFWCDGLQNLRHLIISHNKLRRVSNITFSGLRRLETLHLQSNNITHFDGEWGQDLSSLRNLDVSYNNISSFSPDSLINLTSLEILNIRGNPIVRVDLPDFPLVKTRFASYTLLNNFSKQNPTNPPNLTILYIGEDQWNSTNLLNRSYLSINDVDAVMEKNGSEQVTDSSWNSSYRVFWICMPLLAVALVAAVVASGCCLHRMIIQQKQHRHHAKIKQSIVYVPFTESLKIRGSVMNSRCGTLDIHNRDETRLEGDDGACTRPALKRNQSGLAAAFSGLHKVHCSSESDEGGTADRSDRFREDSSEDLGRDESNRTMLSFKPLGFGQRRRNSLPDRPVSEIKDGWLYEIISPKSEKLSFSDDTGTKAAKTKRDSILQYENIAGRCWTSRAERPTASRKTIESTKYNLLRSLSSPMESETEGKMYQPSLDSPPVAPRPLHTLKIPNNGKSGNLYTETGNFDPQNNSQCSALLLHSDDVNNAFSEDDEEGVVYDEVFDEEDNYIVVLPSVADDPPKSTKQGVDQKLPTPSIRINDIEISDSHSSSKYENESSRSHVYDNAAFTESSDNLNDRFDPDDAFNAELLDDPNGTDDDVESLDDCGMTLSESDEEEDRIELYGDDGKLLRVPSVRDSILTQSTFETVSLLLSLSSENLFTSTSSFEIEEDGYDADKKTKNVSEMHTL